MDVKMENITEKLKPEELFIAYDHIEGKHQKTPLIQFGVVHRDGYEVELYAKMDTLNPGGSFKDRGSEYFIHKAVCFGRLNEGDLVVTASAGNHAKGVAKAAKEHRLKALVYMSSNTPKKKVEGTKRLKAEVVLVDGDYHKAAEAAAEFSRKNNCVYIPAYEHEDIIMGQSTVVTEARIQMYWSNKINPDFFIFPFGGGGLANGGGFASKHLDMLYGTKTYIYAVQAKNFNTMVRSFKAGKIMEPNYSGETIADGIRVPHASEQMLTLSERYIDDMFDVTEEEIKDAIKRVYSSELIRKIQQLPQEELESLYGFHQNHADAVSNMNIVEGAAAAAFACAFADDKIPYEKIARQIYPRKKIIGVIIASGNNIDSKRLEEILAEK